MTTALTVLAIAGALVALVCKPRFSRGVGVSFLVVAVAALVALEAIDAFRDSVRNVGDVEVKLEIQ